MTTKQATIRIECRNCGATGLSTEFPLKDGSAVRCPKCKGTGAEEIKAALFTEKKTRDDVEHVWANIVNYVITPDKFSGGASYQEWLDDPGIIHEIGREIREASCPMSWYQAANHKLRPQWDECNRVNHIPSCPWWNRKDKCWKQFDKENRLILVAPGI